MPWIQISFVVERDRVSLFEAVLENAGALSVTLGDAADEPQLEPPPGATPLWNQVKLTALFPDEPQSLAAVQELSRSLAVGLGAEPRLERIQDRVWERIWMEDFRPARFGRRLWVCPRGQTAGDPDAVVVELDPGLAFGTGHHPTTAMCLRWLDGMNLVGARIIDYGCGSGILAIAALLLGAASAVAVDHDPQALEATVANAEQNGVADRLLTRTPEEMRDEPADLLVANILSGTLVELAPKFAALVRPGGPIALSGILCEQTEQVHNAYTPWFEMDATRTEDEWVLLSGYRRSDPRQSGA